MEWKKFKEIEKNYPELVVLNLIEGFSNATNGLLDIKISENVNYVKSQLGEFQYRLILISENLEKYQFEILKFGYNIELFPVKIIIESSINQEITSDIFNLNEPTLVIDEKELVEKITTVFNSARFDEIVSGLMKISKKYEF